MYPNYPESSSYLSKCGQGRTSWMTRGTLLVIAGATMLAAGYVGNVFFLSPDGPYRKKIVSSLIKHAEQVVDYPLGEIAPVVPPLRSRVPSAGRKIAIDLFSYPAMQQALDNAVEDDLRKVCSGPPNNVDVFINDAAIQNDLRTDHAGTLTVFGLDCRMLGYVEHIAFLVVMDLNGGMKMRQIPQRAESVNMKNTTTVMGSTGQGVVLWNYMTDTLEWDIFLADAHTLVYRETDHKYFGLYPDKLAIELHSPTTACAFDDQTYLTGFDGQKSWVYSNGGSHMNYLTVYGDDAYISERSHSSMKKVNMKTNEVEWVLGGKENTFTIYDIDGKKVEILQGKPEVRDQSQPWNHQHKFQMLDEEYFSMFDNNVGEGHLFLEKSWGADSRMLVLKVDQENQVAREVWSRPVGDQARSYGGTDPLPSGNILGSSYVDWCFPATEDLPYHMNIWEMDPQGEVVWRVAFKGLNLQNPEDRTTPHPHYFSFVGDKQTDLMPVGWNTYNAERAYTRPIITQPCVGQASNGQVYLQFIPTNTVRTQDDYPGTIYLTQQGQTQYIAQHPFNFQKSWLPRPQQVAVPTGYENVPLTIYVFNHWQDFNQFDIDAPLSLETCGQDKYRVFYPSK